MIYQLYSVTDQDSKQVHKRNVNRISTRPLYWHFRVRHPSLHDICRPNKEWWHLSDVDVLLSKRLLRSRMIVIKTKKTTTMLVGRCIPTVKERISLQSTYDKICLTKYVSMWLYCSIVLNLSIVQQNGLLQSKGQVAYKYVVLFKLILHINRLFAPIFRHQHATEFMVP
jgi:hypothetical protein